MAGSFIDLISKTVEDIGYLDAKEAVQENIDMCKKTWDIMSTVSENDEERFLALVAGMTNAMNLGFILGKER